MQITLPNGMVERFNEPRKQPQLNSRYGRRKDGAPREPRSVELAAEQDRRSQTRDVTDPYRGRLLDLTT